MGEARRPSSYCASVFVGGSLSDVELIISDVIGTGSLRYPWSMRLGGAIGGAIGDIHSLQSPRVGVFGRFMGTICHATLPHHAARAIEA